MKQKDLKKIIVKLNSNILLCSSSGLVKEVNEDKFGYRVTHSGIRVCFCDGHWGTQSSKDITEFMISLEAFPKSKKSAIFVTKKIEKLLFDSFGKSNMDKSKDFTPESSFVVYEQEEDSLRVFGYGDVRFSLFRKGQFILKLQTNPTWLGAFSYLGLRNRIPVEKAVCFSQVLLQKGDIIFIYTDGVDECVYETKTLDESFFLDVFDSNPNCDVASNKILHEIIKNGAEDNFSYGIQTYK